MTKQTYTTEWDEEHEGHCEECGIWYDMGSCMIITKEVKKNKLCRKCFDKISKEIDEGTYKKQ